MTQLVKVTTNNYSTGTDNTPVFAGAFNKAVDVVNELSDTVDLLNVDAADFNLTTTVSGLYTKAVTLTATQIVGTAAGDIGHADGAIIIAAPAAAYVLEFVSAVLIYNYSGAAYTGGADDAVFRVGANTASSALDLSEEFTHVGDTINRVGALSTSVPLAIGGTINLYGTALTDPGGATGTLTVHVNYRIHETGL
jgi:hypothetical protein